MAMRSAWPILGWIIALAVAGIFILRLATSPSAVVEVEDRITGRVLKDGQPVAGARIHAFCLQPTATNDWLTSGADGQFELESRGTQCHLSAVLGQHYAKLDPLDLRQPRRLEVDLTPGGRIVGTVVDRAGRPVRGVSVTSYTAPLGRAHTDSTGAFRLEPVIPGPHLLTVGHLPLEPSSSKLTAIAGREHRVSLIVTEELLTLELKSTGGEPVRGIVPFGWIDPSGRCDTTENPAHTEPEGSIGTRYISILHTTYVARTEPLCVRHEDFEPWSGEVRMPAMTVVLHAVPRISGAIRNQQGELVSQAQVSLSRESAPAEVLETTFSEGDGTFVFRGWPPGRYVVRTSTLQGSAAALADPRKREPVKLQLEGTFAPSRYG